jgi:hypothetical protein
VGPRAGLDILEKKKNLLPFPDFEPRTVQPDHSVLAPVHVTYYCVMRTRRLCCRQKVLPETDWKHLQ